MTDASFYETLVTRHVERLRTAYAGEKVQRVLALAAIEPDGARLRPLGFRAFDEDVALAYKRAVRDVLGTAAYQFAKVNFMLAGCRCADCRAAGPE